jgi:3-hydroxyisobutyrate dehydrogenase/putative dehydrogenase
MTRIGWIGLGAMGEPMVRSAARSGIAIQGFDVDAAKRGIDEPDFTFVDSIGAAAAGADLLVVMVTSQAQVESVLFGDDPAAEALAAGAVVMVMSTVGPSAIERWATQLAARGIGIIDAPVSGGVSRAVTGDLLVMVGGPDAAIARAKPLLDTIAKAAPVVGRNPGDGQRVKLVNQLLCGIHIAAAGEALAFAEALDLDLRATWEIIQNGAATSFVFSDRGTRMVSGEFEDVRSALDIWVKDMALVDDAAAELGYHNPLAALTRRLFVAGSQAGLGRLDDSSIIELFRAGSNLD